MQLLLKHFKSEKKIKAATLQELTEVLEAKRAKFVFDYFQQKQ